MDGRDGRLAGSREMKAGICVSRPVVAVVVVVFARQNICGSLGWKMDQLAYGVFMKDSGKTH